MKNFRLINNKYQIIYLLNKIEIVTFNFRISGMHKNLLIVILWFLFIYWKIGLKLEFWLKTIVTIEQSSNNFLSSFVFLYICYTRNRQQQKEMFPWAGAFLLGYFGTFWAPLSLRNKSQFGWLVQTRGKIN